MRAASGWVALLGIGLAILATLLLIGPSEARGSGALQAGQVRFAGNPWPLTGDGRSRVAGWSPDGRTLLVHRWGAVVEGGTGSQVLSELWALDIEGGSAVKLSENAIHPAYSPDGHRLAFLVFSGGEEWEVRVQHLTSGQERAWATADWWVPPAWVDGRLLFGRDQQLWLATGDTSFTPAAPPYPIGNARVRLSPANGRAAWSDGAHLWARTDRTAPPRLLAEHVTALDFAWSPDERRLAYVVADADLCPALWVADVSGERPPVLLAQGHLETFSSPSWSPDGRELAFSRTPIGAETISESDVWLADVEGAILRPLLRNRSEESSPIWSPDGRFLAFHRAGDVWLMDLSRPPSGDSHYSPSRVPLGGESDLSTAVSSALDGVLAPLVQQTPPDAIRVIHRAENYYRSLVPPGQIDTLPFETYVKRAVPVEMPALWAMEALKVQAVAARTYAWYYTILHAGEAWDVSDWVDYQVMGRDDQRHWRSDAGADATQGQYVAHEGEVIKAFYSAENSSPTRSAAGYPYIEAVDDPVGFGEERRGHGWGMSQWGAKRWADRYGWGYQQILTHYYTGVTVELPSSGGPMPIGGATLPWSGFFVTSNRVAIFANASDEASDVSAVGFYVVTDTPTLLITDAVGSDGWSAVWDVAGVGDTVSTTISLTLRIADGQGNVQTLAEPATIGLDRRPPTDVTGSIPAIISDTLTVTLSSLSAVDPGPGSGVRAMAFSNETWTWEGEDLFYQSGEHVDDAGALNGRAWRGLSGIHGAGACYGPYTYEVPPGQAYRAYFRLKTNDTATVAEVALLDVVDSGGARILGLRRLRGTDFRTPGDYQEFAVDFDYPDPGTMGLEFRTFWRATADLYLDRVLVVGYPIPAAATAQWRLTPGEGSKTVTVKFVDGAGNASADFTSTVTLSDTLPPAGWRDFTPEWWSGEQPPTCAVRVQDEVSGLNVDSARYRLSTDGGASWGEWLPAACTGISGTTELQTLTAVDVPFGRPQTTANQIAFSVADLKGLTNTAVYTVRSGIAYLPLCSRD